jgi:hypothetical protein
MTAITDENVTLATNLPTPSIPKESGSQGKGSAEVHIQISNFRSDLTDTLVLLDSFSFPCYRKECYH